MKAPSLLLAAALTLALGSAAQAQTTPAPTPPSNDTNPQAPANNVPRVGRATDGSAVGNNRNRLSPGAGTPATQAAATPAEREARKAARRAAKGKTPR